MELMAKKNIEQEMEEYTHQTIKSIAIMKSIIQGIESDKFSNIVCYPIKVNLQNIVEYEENTLRPYHLITKVHTPLWLKIFRLPIGITTIIIISIAELFIKKELKKNG